MRDEPVGHPTLLIQQPNHLALADEQDHAGRHGRGAAHSNRLAGQTPLAEEISGSEHRHHRFSTGLRQHGQFDAARLNVRDILAGVPLPEDGLASPVLHDGLRNS